MSSPTVVVPYLDDLPTSALLARLAGEGRSPLAACADTGSEEGLDPATSSRRALALGAVDAVARDLRPRVYERFLVPLIRACGPGAERPDAWLAGETYARAEWLLELARERKLSAVAVADSALAEALVARAPKGVTVEAVELADPREVLEGHGLAEQTPPSDEQGVYRVETSLWGARIRGGELDGSWEEVPEDAYPNLVPPWEAADLPEEFELEFDDGLPRRLSGASPDGVNLFANLNRIGRRHAIGRGVSPQLDGGRCAWEAPAATILVAALGALEQSRLDPRRRELKERLGATYRQMACAGELHEPLANDLQAFLTSTLRGLAGAVRVQVYRGVVEIMGVSE